MNLEHCSTVLSTTLQGRCDQLFVDYSYYVKFFLRHIRTILKSPRQSRLSSYVQLSQAFDYRFVCRAKGRPMCLRVLNFLKNNYQGRRVIRAWGCLSPPQIKLSLAKNNDTLCTVQCSSPLK